MFTAFFIALIAIQWRSTAAICPTDLCPKLRNYWPIFNKGAIDVVGGSDLTSQNPQFATDQFGKENSALAITGQNDFWSAPTDYYFGSEYTITAWIRPTNFTWWARMLDFSNPSTQDSVFFAYSQGTTGCPGFNVLTDGIKLNDVPNYKCLTLGYWSYMAVSVKDTQATVYLNGEVSFYQTLNATTKNVSRTQNYIGASYYPGDQYAQMEIDNIKIYKFALSQDEINIDMTFTSYSPCLYSGLTSYWPIQRGAAYDIVAGKNLISPNPKFAADRFGNSAGALQISDETTYWYAPPDYYFLSTSMTLTIWIYPTEFPSLVGRVLEFGNAGFSNNIEISYTYLGNNLPLFKITVDPTTYTFESNLGALQLNSWYHIALVIDQLNVVIYVNGERAGSTTLGQNINIVSRAVNYIGKSSVASDPPAKLNVDDIKIFRKALSPAEVMYDFYAADVAPPTCLPTTISIPIPLSRLSSIVTIGGSNQLTLLDSTSGSLLASIPTGVGDMRAIVYLSTGKFVTASSNGFIYVWNTNFILEDSAYLGFGGIREMVLVSSDVVVVSLEANTKCIISNLTSKSINTFSIHTCIPAGLIAMSNDNIASFACEEMLIWNWKTPRKYVRIAPYTGIYIARQVTDNLIAVGYVNGDIGLYKINDATQYGTYMGVSEIVIEIALYSAELIIVATSPGGMYVINWQTQKIYSQIATGVGGFYNKLRVSQDGYLVITSWENKKTKYYSLSSNVLNEIWSYDGSSFGVLPMSTIQLGPKMYILNKYLNDTPQNLTRSATYTFTATNLFVCPYSYTISYMWTVYQLKTSSTVSTNTLDTSGLAVRSRINLPGRTVDPYTQLNLTNPTMTTLAFTLPGNLLDYGNYRIGFSVSIYVESLNQYFTANDWTYLQIIPSGIIVSVLPNSVSQITIGSVQSLTLDPVLYSSDRDGIVSMSSLSFKFYCRPVSDGVNYLLTGSGYQDLTTGSANDCFDSSNGYSFDSTKNVLTVTGSGFRANSQNSYQFVISTTSNSFNYYQVFNLSVNPTIPSLPVLSISCRVASFCLDSGLVKIFSPSNIMIFDGTVQIDPSIVVNVSYTWTVYKNTGGIVLATWTELSTDEKKNLASSSSELTISSNLFDPSINQYKVVYAITTSSSWIVSLNAAVFSASIVLQANQKPYNGSCSIDLSTGYALDTKFTITCSSWADSDGIIVNYEFFASFANNVNTVNLGNNQTGYFYTTLPSGSPTDHNNLYIFVQIFDNSGGITIYNISEPVVVQTQMATLTSSQAEILSGSTSNPLMQAMKSSDLSVASSAIIAYASSFNQVASSSEDGGSSLTNEQIESAKKVNALFVDSMKSYDLSDLSSIKAASSVLSVVTANTDLLSTESAAKVSDMCALMTEKLIHSAGDYSLEFIYQAASYIIDASANSIETLNQASASDKLETAVTKQINLIKSITKITSEQLPINGSKTVDGQNIHLTITRASLDTIKTNMVSSSCQAEIVNPCGIAGKSKDDCADEIVISEVYFRKKALVLDSGLNMAGSSSVSLSFYDNEMNEYTVSNQQDGFYFWMSMDSSDQATSYSLFNSSNASINSLNQLQAFTLTLNSSNQAVTVLLSPNETNSTGYIMCLKYGQAPVVNSTTQIFDLLRVYCPWDLQLAEGRQAYKMFSNMSANTVSATKVGYGFRQLTEQEYSQYCQHGLTKSISQAPVLSDSYDFKSLVSNKVFTLAYASGCYYIDESTMSYSSTGVEVLSDSNTTLTHCVASHLTEFAGGMVVLPSSIDFNNVWANADFTKNMTIYLTVIIICSLYILLFVLCRYMDWRDDKRKCLYVLRDNCPTDVYFYEMVVFTGGRQNAGTLSTVSFVLGGDQTQTGNRTLKAGNSKNKILQRGAVDSFLLSTRESLGQLQYMRIWHDNSGRDRFASWFLKFIIVHDLQTREKFYFICNDWLAVEKSDGSINRTLSVATSKQKTDLKYLMEKQTKEKMSDGHLWFSIVARPTKSSFNRTERLTCAFVLLCLTMLMNIMYYESASSNTGNEFVFGPFSLSQTQIVIGVITNLIIFPPSFLLLQIFRKSRPRKTRIMKLKEHVNETIKHRHDLEYIDETSDHSKKKKLTRRKKFTLPWWFKIIGYILSFAVVTVCIFFIIVKGISFGDNLCRKWLTSFLISILTSIFLTQPIQVALLSIFFVLLFRKSNDDEDLEYDHYDDGQQINKIKFNNSGKRTEDDENTVAFVKSLANQSNEILLKEMRRKKQIEDQALSMLKKILVYAIFLSVLFMASYSKTNPLAYKYQTQLRNLLLPNITRIQTVDQIYTWTKNQFMPAMIASSWYNQQPTSSELSSYLKDYNSMLVGSVLFRQSRVVVAGCSRTIGKNVCAYDYGASNYDNKNYGVDWTDRSSSSFSQTVKQAFLYSKASSLNSQPYAGEFGNYLGGGYAFQIDTSVTNLTESQIILSDLEENEWINERTRAVFIEFTVYNVNVDLFAYCTVLFEILSTGSIIVSYQFEPISLFTEDSVVIVAFDILYLFITVFMLLKEIKLMIKLKMKYLTEWWSYLNWTVIIFSWVAFTMYLYRIYEKSKLIKIIKAKDDQIANFQTITYWNSLMIMFLAFCCFLGSVKLLKVFSFSRHIKMLMRVFRECFKEMMSFIVIYLIMIMAFTQLMYLMSYDSNLQFKSFATSLVTGFLIIIGKFNTDSFTRDVGSILGPMIYSAFTVTMVLILLNLFITLITNKFSQIRNEYREEHRGEDSLFLTYLKETVIPGIKNKVKSNKNKYNKRRQDTELKDSVDLFEARTSHLVYQIDANTRDFTKRQV